MRYGAPMTASPSTGAGRFRYGALAHALWSLRGPSFFEEPRPAERAVAYRPTHGRGIAPRYDVYLPERARTGASVLLVHGGGFTLGSRDMRPMRFLASRLVAAGIAACSVDYRMILRGGRLDEALDDVGTALDHWRVRAEREHGLDPGRISMAGLSAGATLAMLVAGARGDAVHRLACGFGLYELDHLEGNLASVVPRLLFRTPDRRTWRARSPREAAQPRVPTLLLHGTADGLVPVEQSHRLAAHREALGLPTRLVVYPDAPHGFFQFPCDAAHAGAEEIVQHVSG